LSYGIVRGTFSTFHGRQEEKLIMKQERRNAGHAARRFALTFSVLGIALFSNGTLATQPNDVTADSHNILWLGHADLQ
jgi:hypothetical protein